MLEHICTADRRLVVYNNMKIGGLLYMYIHHTKKYNKGKYIIMYINEWCSSMLRSHIVPYMYSIGYNNIMYMYIMKAYAVEYS